MRLSKEVGDQLWKLVEPVVAEVGFELVDIDFRQENHRNILDIVIDKENGITVDDCAIISEKVSLLLDVEDLIEQKYYLEVGSPGIFRELKREKDLVHSIGKRVKVSFKSPVKGQKQFVGMLKAFEEPTLTLNNDLQEVVVKRDNIKKIHLHPEL